MSLKHEGLCNCRQDLIRNQSNVGCNVLVRAYIRDGDSELVTTKSDDGIDATHGVNEPMRYLFEEKVSRSMT